MLKKFCISGIRGQKFLAARLPLIYFKVTKTCAAYDAFKHVIPILVRHVFVEFQNRSSKKEKSLNAFIAGVADAAAD